MKEKYAQLQMYYGLAQAWNITEGRFDEKNKNYRWIKAIKEINDSLKNWIISPMVIIPEHNLVTTFNEYHKLSKYIFDNFEGSEKILKPFNCIDGKIEFYNLINIPGYEKSQRKELVSLLKESGHIINNVSTSLIEYKKRHYESFPKKLKKIEKELEKKRDEIWKDSLKFF